MEEFEKVVRQRQDYLNFPKAVEIFKTFTDNEELIFLFHHIGNWFRPDKTDIVMNAKLAINIYGIWQSDHPLIVEFKKVIETLRLKQIEKYLQRLATDSSISPENKEELKAEQLTEIRLGRNCRQPQFYLEALKTVTNDGQLINRYTAAMTNHSY